MPDSNSNVLAALIHDSGVTPPVEGGNDQKSTIYDDAERASSRSRGVSKGRRVRIQPLWGGNGNGSAAMRRRRCSTRSGGIDVENGYRGAAALGRRLW